METYRIDSHKLHLHPRRVADWLEGKAIAPIYLEVSPSGACNHRCRFCGLDFMGYKPRFLPTQLLCQRLAELGALGVKSIMYAGEGEPFLHRDMTEIAKATKAAGIDVAFTTNGVNLRPDIARAVLPVTSWIKVSCNAGRPETYAAIHGTGAADFDKVLDNIGQAVALRRELGSRCTLGVQLLLLPENRDEAVSLARIVREIGADYLVIKPYSVHRLSGKDAYKSLRYGECDQLAATLAELDTDTFKVLFRHAAMNRRETEIRAYDRCLALPFWGYVDSGGVVWGCLRHIGEPHFRYGNILERSAGDIFCGGERRENMNWCANHLDITDCQVDCRMDPVNMYLWELTRPGAHANFI